MVEKFKYARAIPAMILSPYLLLTKLRKSNIAIDVQLEPTHDDVG